MNKIKFIFMSFILTVCLSVTAFAAGNAVIDFDSYESDDGKIYVDVNISENDASMIQFCVEYDSESLECVSASAGDVFSGKTAPLINVTEGKIYFIWDALEPLGDSGTLLHIEYALKAEKDSEVGIAEDESFVVANSKFEDIGSVSGSVIIEKAPESSSSEADVPGNSALPSEPEESSSSASESEVSSSVQEEETTHSEKEETGAPPADTSQDSEKPDSGVPEIELDMYSAELTVGEEIIVTASGAEDIVWFSSNESVAVVSEGKITALSYGTAIITAMTEDGTKEAACVVSVSALIEDAVAEESGPGTLITESDEVIQEKESGTVWYVLIAVFAVAAATVAIYFVKIKK